MSLTASVPPQRHASPPDRGLRRPRIPRWPIALVVLALTAGPHDEEPATADDLRPATSVSVTCGPATVGIPTECTASVAEKEGGGSQRFPIRVATYDNEQGGQPSRDEAVARAQRFDVITAGPHQYKANVAAMKAANPGVVLNVYVNGTHTRRTDLPESQYCHDAAGDRITSTGVWSGNILMNPANRGWRDTLYKVATARLSESGYDGVFLDVLGRGALLYNVSGRCIDPRTSEAYTAGAWEQDTSDLARSIREWSSRPVVANGASRGAIYFPSPPSSVVARYVDAGLAEGFTRNGAFFEGFYTEGQIVKDVDMVVDVPKLHVLAKDWRTVSSATKDQEMRYAFAAFLLGTDGADLFGWTGSKDSLTAFDPLWDVDLGAPRGSYYGTGSGRYRRDFERGHVILDTVAHTGTIEPASVGGGSVTWSTSSAGTFDATRCTPVASGGATSCTVRYVPAEGSVGTHLITATYEGDQDHGGSSGELSLPVARRDSTTDVTCDSPVTLPATSGCTATVTDASAGTSGAPAGTVAFAAAGGGSFTPASCELVARSGSSSSCSVTYAPTIVGDDGIRADYAGGPDHSASASPSPFTVVVEAAPAEDDGGSSGEDEAPPADAAAPTAEFTSPLDGGTVTKGQKIVLEAIASDDVAVVVVEFAVNGGVRCTDTVGPWTCSWRVPRGSTTTHSLSVTAWDAAGNSTTASIVVAAV